MLSQEDLKNFILENLFCKGSEPRRLNARYFKKEFFVRNFGEELYNSILESFEDYVSFRDKVLAILWGGYLRCGQCGKIIQYPAGRISTVERKFYCSLSCSNGSEDRNSKISKTWRSGAPNSKRTETFNRVYGEDYKIGFSNGNIQKRIRDSVKNKYGVINISQLEETKNKKRNSMISRYGVEHYAESPAIMRRIFEKRVSKLGLFIPHGFDSWEDLPKHIHRWSDKYKSYIELILNGFDGLTDLGDSRLRFIPNTERYRIGLKLGLIKSEDIPSRVTKYHKMLCDFLDSHNIEYVVNSRKVISPLEVDIFLPKYNLAIEYNGYYWHSDGMKYKNYHFDKTTMAGEIGVKLFHIFEYEDFSKSIDRLSNMLGLNTRRIFARNLHIRELSKNEEKEFFDETHDQGFVQSKICFGLFSDSELVSAMSFGVSGRFGGVRKESSYELLRFSTKQRTSVVGGASKLLKHFIREYSPKKIVTYRNRKYGLSDFYPKLGFSFVKVTPPNYVWLTRSANVVLTRYQTQRHKLGKLFGEEFEEILSESDIMYDKGFLRVWDSGNEYYEMNIS